MTYILLTLTTISFIILFYLSHQNGEDTHETSQTLTDHLSFLLPDTETLHANLRRYAHIILFAVFTFLFTLTLHNSHYPYYFLVFPLLYTWADEATKVFIPGRHFSWFDVGLNLIGVVIGVVLGFAVVGKG